MSLSKKIPTYQVDRGLSLIFYMKDKPTDERPVSNYGKGDCVLSKNMWVILSCDVLEYEDPSREDILQAVKDVKGIFDCTPRKYNFMSVTFIGHGYGGSIEDTDIGGGKLNLEFAYLALRNQDRCTVAELQSWFSVRGFPDLIDCPILFVIQACRGILKEQLVVASHIIESSSTAVLCETANIYTIYPSAKNKVSWYYPIKGESYLIRALSEVFSTFYQDDDINELLLRVKNKIATEVNTPGFAQTVFTEESLTKRLYFPGKYVMGKRVCIYNKTQPHMDELEKICKRPDTKDLPVFVLAVAGEFRTGKSFLLSYFLRYLVNHPQYGKDWIGSADEPLIGFDHKSTPDPVTEGINIWNKPFLVKGPGDQKLLVLIMDCQGVFAQSDQADATKVFALATMVTSMMIFNLSKQINMAILGNLELFTAYAKMACTDEGKPFQKSMLLIRDWQYPRNHPYGFEGGKEYYCKNKGDGNSLDETYQEIKCFLMPKPGDCVDDENYDGNWGELKPVFTENLRSLIENILSPKHVADHMKKVTGNQITAGQFCDYFKSCCDLLDKIDFQDPSNMLKMNANFMCSLAKENGLCEYKRYMNENTNSYLDKATNKVITEAELKNIHSSATTKATQEYDDKSSFSKKNLPELYEEVKKEFVKEMNDTFNTVYKKQRELIMEGEAAKEKAETERKRAEAEKLKAEKERRAKEAAKEKAETERKRAEAEKRKAECERKEKEAAREKAETERKRAEAEKQKAECERKEKDAAKERAETERKRAEAERLKAENERRAKEAAEELANVERKRADAERQKAEDERKAWRKKQEKIGEMEAFFATTEDDWVGEMKADGRKVTFRMSDTEQIWKGAFGAFGRWATLNALNRIQWIIISNVDSDTKQALEDKFRSNGTYMNMKSVKEVLIRKGKTLASHSRDQDDFGEKLVGVVTYRLRLDD